MRGDIVIPDILGTIARDVDVFGGRAILVGGCVRDYFLGVGSKDYDVEVYGLGRLEELEEILKCYGRVNLVGKSFGILKFVYDGDEYDFSFPRRESKVSKGHRGFDVEVDGNLSFEDAFRRRDFTINALGYDISAREFIDIFGGLDDINRGIIRYVDSKTFVEDPLRVYRGVQFCARFEFEMESDTKRLSKEMIESNMLDELAKERVYEEIKKLLLKSQKPSIGFELMRELGIIKRYFPELYAIIGVEQSPKYHPEGDVWIHTMMALDSMAKILKCDKERDEKDKLRLMLAILCHDLGKATHTSVDSDGNIRSIGHERAGVEPTKKMLSSLTSESSFIDTILPLVEHHLKPSQFFQNRAKASAIRRLATKVNIEDLVVVARADFLGRTTLESLEGRYEAGDWLLSEARELNVDKKALKPLILGRDLIALGFTPSPKFKEILDELYAKQLDGEIRSREEGLEYIITKFSM